MKNRQAFTLVELVVVILILGILAGVAAPKLFNQSAEATDNGLRQTLAVVRNAIELYAAENNGNLPPCTSTGADFRTALQDYIRGPFPTCPVGPVAAQDNEVLPSTSATPAGVASPTSGWVFSTNNGTFICGFNGATASNSSINYDQF